MNLLCRRKGMSQWTVLLLPIGLGAVRPHQGGMLLTYLLNHGGVPEAADV